MSPSSASTNVAVIIAACNSADYSDIDYVDDAIRSVRSQEVDARVKVRAILVDCSAPEFHIQRSVLSAPPDSIVRVRPSVKSLDPGVCMGIMRGVGEAGVGCEWVVPLNADDTLAPNFVEECLRTAARDGRSQCVLVSAHPLTEEILRDNYIAYCCMARRSWWLSFPGFVRVIDDGGPTDPLADWDLWVRVWQRYGSFAPVAYVDPRGGDERLFVHRERDDSAFKQWGMERVLAMRAEMWRKRGVVL